MNTETKQKKEQLSIRFTETEINRIKRACFRDEMKPALFCHGVILKAIDDLLKSQEKNGFKCMEAI